MRKVKVGSLVVLIAMIALMCAVTAPARADDDFKSVYTFNGAVVMGRDKIIKNPVVLPNINAHVPTSYKDSGGNTIKSCGDIVGIGPVKGGKLLGVPQGFYLHATVDIGNLTIRSLRFSFSSSKSYSKVLEMLSKGQTGNEPKTVAENKRDKSRDPQFVSLTEQLKNYDDDEGARWYDAIKDPESKRWHFFVNTIDCQPGMLTFMIDVNHRNDKDYARIFIFNFSRTKVGDYDQPVELEILPTSPEQRDEYSKMPFILLYDELKGFDFAGTKSYEQKLRDQLADTKDATEEDNINLRKENERLKKELEAKNNAPIPNLVPSPPVPAFVPAPAVVQPAQPEECSRQREAPIAGGDRQVPAVRVVALQAKINGQLLQDNNVVLRSNNDSVDFYLMVNDPSVTSSRVVVTRLDSREVVLDSVMGLNEIPRLTVSGQTLSNSPGVPFQVDISAGGKTWKYTITRRNR